MPVTLNDVAMVFLNGAFSSTTDVTLGILYCMHWSFKSLLLVFLLGCGMSTTDKPDGGRLMIDADEDEDENETDAFIARDECVLDTVVVQSETGAFEIFTYEAGRHSDGTICSMRALLPIHSTTQPESASACASIQWRLCTLTEITRACAGPAGLSYPYGRQLIEGQCNIRDAYVQSGDTESSVAPSGHFAACVSEEGIFDLTGNVWEWVAVSDRNFVYFGAGHRIIAQRHRDEDHSCNSFVTLPPAVGAQYQKDTVGFRCCRDVAN